jgi:transcriptional regulator with XRE-family HTH domain
VGGTVKDQGAEVGRFLRARRDALQPEDVGLPREPGRRVPGLRREEVAALAGISPEYYLRLEQGRDHQPSEQVLLTLGRALRLDLAGQEYLHRLVHPFRPRAVVPAPRRPVDASLAATVAALGGTPAFVTDANKDIVLSNDVVRLMQPGVYDPGQNLLLNTFDPVVKELMPGWEALARRQVAALRLTARPEDARLQEVVGTLSVRDEDFRRWWSAHEVSAEVSGRVSVAIEGYHVVTLGWYDLQVPDHDGHVLTVFRAEDPIAAAGLDLLAARARERSARRDLSRG